MMHDQKNIKFGSKSSTDREEPRIIIDSHRQRSSYTRGPYCYALWISARPRSIL